MAFAAAAVQRPVALTCSISSQKQAFRAVRPPMRDARPPCPPQEPPRRPARPQALPSRALNPATGLRPPPRRCLWWPGRRPASPARWRCRRCRQQQQQLRRPQRLWRTCATSAAPPTRCAAQRALLAYCWSGSCVGGAGPHMHGHAAADAQCMQAGKLACMFATLPRMKIAVAAAVCGMHALLAAPWTGARCHVCCWCTAAGEWSAIAACIACIDRSSLCFKPFLPLAISARPSLHAQHSIAWLVSSWGLASGLTTC